MNEKTATTTSSRPKVAIVGAGVCGLGVAWRLAQQGCAVTVFERGEIGRGASWAAAGMLAANVESEPGEEALLSLTLEAQRQWPTFAAELEAASGREIGYREDGTLVAAVLQDDVERLRFTYDYQRGLGLDLAWLSGREARAKEPSLSPQVSGAVWSANDHQVDNRFLVLALAEAATRAGAEIHCGQRVHGLTIAQGHCRGVDTASGFHAADAVLLAAGAWSRDIGGLSQDVAPPVRPLKGQALALGMDPQAPLLKSVLWGPRGLYAVPREDGRLIVGATVEEKGWDDALTAGGLMHLLWELWQLLPGTEELPVEETWVGHRPSSRDDAPILGPSSVAGLHFATGHHRNGILLAPLTADLVAEGILHDCVPERIAPFGPGRFASAPSPIARTAAQ